MDFHIPQEPATDAPSRLGAFAHPAFAIVWVASTCALLGIAMYDTASGWLMTTLDVDPFEVSLVHAATMLPMFLFTLPAGAIADIVDPRRMIIAVSSAFHRRVAKGDGCVMRSLYIVRSVDCPYQCRCNVAGRRHRRNASDRPMAATTPRSHC